MNQSVLSNINNEIKRVCSLLDDPLKNREILPSVIVYLTKAIERVDQESWSQIDWQGFVRMVADCGISPAIFNENKAIVFAVETGLLLPSFSFERGKMSSFEHLALHVSNVTIATLKHAVHWGVWLEPDVKNLGLNEERLRPNFGAKLSDVSAKGFEPPKLIGTGPDTGVNLTSYAFSEPSVGAAIDKAESEGMLDFFKESGRLEPWAVLCMVHGNEERLKRALKAGADFSKLSAQQAWQVFIYMSDQSGPGAKQWQRSYGAGSKKQMEEAFAWDAQLKNRIWKMAVSAGMPRTRCEKGADKPHEISLSHWMGQASGLLARTEIERDGLRGQVALRWLLIASLAGMDEKAFDATQPVVWGLGHGLLAEDLNRGALMDAAILGQHSTSKTDALLLGLAALNVKLTGPERGGFSNDSESLLGRLMHIGASGAAVEAAIKVGVDWRACNASGDPVIKQLFALNRAGGYESRLMGLIAGVGPEHSAELLGQKDKDGAGPMHWAARALCADSIKHLHALGLSPNDKDAKGASSGHWAARKYGAGKDKKIASTLVELTRCNQDWKILDHKGKSALAALCAKGPLEPVAALLEKEPSAMEAKGKSGKSAKDALIKRSAQDPRAGSMVEQADISASVAPVPTGDAPAKSNRRRI